MKRLTLDDLDDMIHKANRRARATGRARRSGFADNTGPIEHDLVEMMRPHFIKILKLARAQLLREI